MTTRRLLILGTRTFASEIADWSREIPGVEVVGFVENRDRGRCADLLDGLPIVWVEDLASRIADHVFACGLGTTQRGRFVAQVAAMGARFTTLVHPTARVSPTSRLGDGSLVNVFGAIAAHTVLGAHVSVNRGALVGHHDGIGDYVTIGPGARIGGNTRIGARTYVGMGAIVLDNLTVGEGCVIGAGAVVTRDLPDRVLAVGVPARIAKTDIEPK